MSRIGSSHKTIVSLKKMSPHIKSVSHGKMKNEETWSDVFYQCIENAMEILIDCKNQDFP